jgi:hypothetical protein
MYKRSIIIFMACYVLSYFFISFFGRYEESYSAIGKIFGPCLCFSSVEQWQPAYTVFAKDNSGKIYTNIFGKVYYPLISVDQKWWHLHREIPTHMLTPEEIEKQMENLRKYGHI